MFGKEPVHYGQYVIMKRRKDTTSSGIVVSSKAENMAVVVSAKNIDAGTVVVFSGEMSFTHNNEYYLVTHEDRIMAILGNEEW